MPDEATTYPPMAGGEPTSEEAAAHEAAANASTAAATADTSVTLSQSKIDSIIASRVAETKAATEAKFADYDTLKGAAAKLAEIEAAQLTATEKLQKAVSDAEARAVAAEGSASELQLKMTRLRVAGELNLPIELADRLQGDTEEALRADAEKVLAIVKPADRQGERKMDGGAKHEPDEISFEELRRMAREDPAKFNKLVDEGKVPASAMRPSA